jgi:tetratricopeptide (TPR) repeat protein
MQEIRICFSPAEGSSYSVSLTDNAGQPIGAVVPFEPFLTDDNYADLRWYLEAFMDLPDGGALIRAQRVEAELLQWGRRLHDALFLAGPNQIALQQLLTGPEPRTLTIASNAPELLQLPWELLADEAGWLALRLSVRRQIDVACAVQARAVKLPLRMLYIVSRPEDTGFIDPRLTSQALLDAIDPLGASVQLDFCRPPTLARLGELLRDGQRAGDPYDVVHFDGHGTFMQAQQLGTLSFEQADDGSGAAKTDNISADQLGYLLAQHQVPLVVLEACRSATVGQTRLSGAVAPRLIQAGVGSVLAMGHAVHVEAARLLLDRFYRELVRGASIGQAVAGGRSALSASAARWLESGPGARSVKLKDWFLPQLYQRGADLVLLPGAAAAPPSVRQFDLFMSYQHNDGVRVDALARTLSEQHGLRVWLDKWECRPGKLKPQCEAGIRSSRFTVVVGSQSALNSKWVQWEVTQHRKLNPDADHLLPLKLEAITLPKTLNELLWLDFTQPEQDSDNAAQLARLIRSADAADARQRRGFRAPARGRDEFGPFPPPPLYGFHGRARELHALERQWRHQRGIVLHAMGGMGKTTLATEAAHWWTRSGLFANGACFVSFEQFTSAERVVQVLGCYLEGENFNQRPASEQRRRAIEAFQQQPVLMVWDNFESTLPQFNSAATALSNPYTDEVRAELAVLFHDLTTGPGLGCLLVTCRPEDTELPGTGHHELQGLARADSLWLLANILKRHNIKLSDPRLNREQLDPLLADLADHPLSLELVGPHLRTLTPQAIRADFGQLLAKFQQAAPEGRNTSLLASLEFSLRHVSAATRAALPWLGLFSGGVFEINFLNLSQLTPEDWAPIRRELESIALLRVETEIQMEGRPFLRFHPTLALAVEDGVLAAQAPIRQRLIKVYLAMMLELDRALHGSQSRAVLQVLDREVANYRKAVHWAVDDGLLSEAAYLGDLFSRYLKMSGRLREHGAWVSMLRAATLQGAFTVGTSSYGRQYACTLFYQGDQKGALAQLRTLIARLRVTTEFNPASELALAIGSYGQLLNKLGRTNQAIPVLQEAHGLCETLVEQASGKPWQALLAAGEQAKAALMLGNLAATMGDLADALRNDGDYKQALALAENALQIVEKNNNQREVATCHGLCASILMAEGRYDEADARYEKALLIGRLTGDQELEGTTLQHRGSLALHREQYPRATIFYQQALRHFQAADNHRAMMQTYNSLGVVEQNSGRLAEARTWIEKAHQMAVELKDQDGIGRAAHNIGVVCQLEGKAARKQGNEAEAQICFHAALRAAENCLQIDRSFWNKPEEALSHSLLAQIHVKLGNLDAAEHHAHQAREIHEALGLPDVSENYRALCEIANARNDSVAAAEWADKRDAKIVERKRLASGEGT